MKKKVVSMILYGMCCIGLFLGIPATAQATEVQSKVPSQVLPAAGLSLVLEDGASLKTIKPDSQVPIVEPVVVEVSETVEVAQEEDAYFSTLVIAQVDSYVNIRSAPDTESEVLGKLYDESVGELIDEENGWYLMKSGTVTGYVKAEYVVTGEAAIQLAKEVGTRFATVTTTTLYVREEPNKDSAVMGMIAMEEQLVALEEVDGWAKVSIEAGEGYASMEYLTMHTEFVEAESKEEEEARLAREAAARAEATRAAEAELAAQAAANATTTTSVSGSGTGSAIANFAMQFVGNPYVYGGTSLTNGADCSGFVQSVYKNFGVSLPRTATAQRGVGSNVGGLGNAQPGDIVCYSGHVGIYIGNGQLVHASTPETGIKISTATYKPILSIRRIF